MEGGKGPRVRHRQRQAAFIGPNRLVLGPVVLEQAHRLASPGNQQDVSKQQRQSGHSVHQVEEKAPSIQRRANESAQAVGEQVGRGDKQPHHRHSDDRQHQPKRELRGAPSGLFLCRHNRVLRGKLQRGESIVQRLYEHQRAPEKRPSQKRQEGQQRRPLLFANGDRLIRATNRHHEALWRPHHHAFDDRLPADVGFGQHSAYALAFGPFAGFFSGLAPGGCWPSYFFRKRSTRPAVSTSLYLPVKKGWQLAQISTANEPRVERVSITLPQAQVIRAGGYRGWISAFTVTASSPFPGALAPEVLAFAVREKPYNGASPKLKSVKVGRLAPAG